MCDHGQKLAFPENVYTKGVQTVCEVCTEPADDMYVTSTCTVTKDTEFAWCNRCGTGSVATETREAIAEGEAYIDDQCVPGKWDTLGHEVTCADCTKRNPKQYTVWHCDSTDIHDSLHAQCSECAYGEYQFAECTDSADTVCPVCTGIENCKDGKVQCTNANDSVCDECEDGFFGPTCCYEQSLSACGSMTTRERRANQYGFEDEGDNVAFIQFCLEMCDEFPDCMAFEVQDGGEDFTGSGANEFSGRGASCYFKSAYSQLTTSFEQDCYSNICRQGEGFLDFTQYEEQELVAQAHALYTSHKGDLDDAKVGSDGLSRFG